MVHGSLGAATTVTCRTDGDRAVFGVADTGIGMTPEVTERSTERFFRADRSRSRSAGGNGLGLSIVDLAVTAHDGTLDIESESGVGTSVIVTLPLTPATSSPT